MNTSQNGHKLTDLRTLASPALSLKFPTRQSNYTGPNYDKGLSSKFDARSTVKNIPRFPEIIFIAILKYPAIGLVHDSIY
jgi:hypothetical protein